MIRLAYIAAPSYSGSTLLTFLLGAHPHIATIGELKWGTIDLDSYQCSCGDLLSQCRFWQNIVKGMQERGLDFDLNRPDTDFRLRGSTCAGLILRARIRNAMFERVRTTLLSGVPRYRKWINHVAHVNRCVIEVINTLQNGDVFLDGSKDPVRLRHLLATDDYDVRVIQLVRDGRAVLDSAINNQQQTAKQATKDWLLTHKQIERLKRKLHPNQFYSVKYEDLCTDTESILSGLYQFLDLENTYSSTNIQSFEHHILGNRMRLQMNGKITLDEKWRHRLNISDLAVFEHIAGRFNKRLGYGDETTERTRTEQNHRIPETTI